MKRNINFGLLVLIIAILFCFCIAAVYYQITFRNLNQKSKTKLSELQKVTSTLVEKKAELAETSAKEETLKDKYIGVKSEKEKLADEVSSLKTQLKNKIDELLDAKTKLKNAEAVAATYLEQKEEYQRKYSSCNNDLDNVCDELHSEGASHEDCGD